MKGNDRENNEMATKAQKLAAQGLESLTALQDEVKGAYLQKTEFSQRFDVVTKEFESKLEMVISENNTELADRLEGA